MIFLYMAFGLDSISASNFEICSLLSNESSNTNLIRGIDLIESSLRSSLSIKVLADIRPFNVFDFSVSDPNTET